MNGRHFLEWFEHTLCPALENPSVIVMDNAPYHNIRIDESLYPTRGATKQRIMDWLDNKQIRFSQTDTKAELLQIVRRNKPQQIFKTDMIALQHGHLVLRLPVRHCELNPIEIIQAGEKNYVARNNKTFKLKDVERLFHEAKDRIKQPDWQKAERHVIEKVEKRFWEVDGVLEEEVEPCIINDADESDEEDTESTVESSVSQNREGTDLWLCVCPVCNGVDPPIEAAHCTSWIQCDFFDLICVFVGETMDTFLCKNCK